MKFVGVRIIGMNEYEVTIKDADGYLHTFRVDEHDRWSGDSSGWPEAVNFARAAFRLWKAGKSVSHSGTDMA